MDWQMMETVNCTLMPTTWKHFSISLAADLFTLATAPNFWLKSTSWRVDWIERLCCHNVPSEYYDKCQRVMRNCAYEISFTGWLSAPTTPVPKICEFNQSIFFSFFFLSTQKRCRRMYCAVWKIYFSNLWNRKVECTISRTHSTHFRGKNK